MAFINSSLSLYFYFWCHLRPDQVCLYCVPRDSCRSETWGPCLSLRAGVISLLLCWLLIFVTFSLNIKWNEHLHECFKHSWGRKPHLIGRKHRKNQQSFNGKIWCADSHWEKRKILQGKGLKTKMKRTLLISKRDTSGKGVSEERIQDKYLKAAMEKAVQKHRKCLEKLKGEEGCHQSCLEVTNWQVKAVFQKLKSQEMSFFLNVYWGPGAQQRKSTTAAWQLVNSCYHAMCQTPFF